MLRQLTKVFGTMLVLLLLAGSTAIGICYLSGGRIAAVQTSSMEPEFAVGDAVLLTAADTYKPGDIIRYQDPLNAAVTITHRIVTVNQQTGFLTTKGDALTKADRSIPPKLVSGRVVAVAPRLGRLIDQLHRPAVLLAVICIPAIVLVVSEAWRLARELRLPYRLPGYGP